LLWAVAVALVTQVLLFLLVGQGAVEALLLRVLIQSPVKARLGKEMLVVMGKRLQVMLAVVAGAQGPLD
jgi:hypothetical protein